MSENRKATEKSRIVVHEGSRVLIVSSEEDVQIMSSPQRQRIFKLLHLEGVPLHGKDIGDRLGIKPASAHFHLKKLEKIGVVKQSHTKLINGITARYYEAAVDSFILDEDFINETDDVFTKEKLRLLHNTFNTFRDDFISSLHQVMKEEQTGIQEVKRLHLLLDFMLYLSDEDEELFQKEMQELFSKYTKPAYDKSPHSVLFSINRTENK
ncbi:winged helix-turn-helix domain-containing protein [Amphibacillus jilinensis]|uniref:winged helix-turn-helix domain-containing protein n=1 Tax=Amphibacillus jilinensis TaxID=1216008 RepID=UPI0003083436|nr:winged helix-turn-helix domain-containing protein [Amphibacillus jilinensis]